MITSEFPLVSIITVNYNSEAVTVDLLKSINHLTYPNVEVIVVDNASKEVPEAAFLAAFRDTIIVRSDKNLGFAGGNNLGVDQAKGELVFFVNNDTELTPDILEGLVDIFKKHEDAGMASPKFHFYFQPGVIEYAGYEQINKFTGRNGMVGHLHPDKGQHDEIKVTNYAHGGGMMVPKHVIENVGKMFEGFFLYYEELDWAELIKKGGYKIYYQPKSLIYHKRSMTVGKGSVLKTYYLSRNRILFMRRHHRGLRLFPFLLYLCMVTIPKNVLSHLAKLDMGHLKAFLNGVLWNIKHPKLERI